MSIYLGTSPIASTGYDKANTDLSNLTNTGKNIANWSNNVTNCITEIPQDIKLELNNGTLTLKAGSKVYVPNGTGVFDEVTVSSDVTATSYGFVENAKVLLFYVPSTSRCDYESNCVSGSSHTPSTYSVWYDTTNNVVNRYTDNSSTAASTLSFPIAIISIKNYVFDSIDQVFNGFGYIGSTVFALPGVKGLIPNGRNEDGSLKNTEFTVESVLTETYSSGHTFNNLGLTITVNSVAAVNMVDVTYKKGENLLYNGSSVMNKCISGFYTTNNGSVGNFNPKTVFRALDWSDSPTISGWSMPSSRYIDLTLGASGAQYTAPANGYVILAGQLSANTWLNIRDDDTMTNIYQAQQLTTAYSMGYMFAVKKGGKFSVSWGNGYWTGQAWQNFRFVYAEGE